MREKLPNFLVVGAHKSGTTSIYEYVKQHPDVYIHEKKEGKYFSSIPFAIAGLKVEDVNSTITKTLGDYNLLFKSVNNERAIGDVSPDYLYFYKNSIENIKKILGDKIKIIIILRDPIERAFSNYTFYVAHNLETLSFEEALKQETVRKKTGFWWAYRYTEIGFYYEQVKAYIENFVNIKIYLFEDFKKNPLDLIKNIYAFLEVDTSFVPNINIVHNISGIPKNILIHNLITKKNIFKKILKPIAMPLVNLFLSSEKQEQVIKIIIQNNLIKPSIKQETRNHLKKLYFNDIQNLQRLINKDLSGWLM